MALFFFDFFSSCCSITQKYHQKTYIYLTAMALINDFMSLIYPRFCAACEQGLLGHENLVCNKCRLDLPRSRFHLNEDHELARVLAGRIPFRKSMSYFVFEKKGRVQELLHTIKYREGKALAEYLGQEYARELMQDRALESIDLIVPIPLHEKKKRSRGFNQSEHFAMGLSSVSGIPLNTTCLIRIAETSTQTQKKKFERWENVREMFALQRTEAIAKKHILVVDDVITTGATLEAAWLCLQQAEGIQVSLASIAFARKF